MPILNQCPKCHVDLASDQDACPHCGGETTGNAEERVRNARLAAIEAKEKDLRAREDAFLAARETEAKKREEALKAAGV